MSLGLRLRLGQVRARLEDLARRAKRDGIALYLATRDPRVPWHVKALAVLVAAYVLSPIDLIPDFIPVIGYADDALIVAIALRSVIRHAGVEAIDRNWPGSTDGLGVIHRLAGRSTSS